MSAGFITASPAIPSPCIDICRVEHRRCIGCRRTLDEIARWRGMGDGERRRIMAELPTRG